MPAVEVIAPVRSNLPGWRLVSDDEQRGDRDDGDADRHVDEQHPAPGQPLGDQTAEHQAERAAAGDDGRVDGERLDPLPALGEGADHQREHRGRGERAADALDGAGRQQHPGRGGEAAGQRGEREDGEAGDEHPAAAEDVARATAQQQQPAEGQRVPVHHPGQAGRGEVQAVLDVRQGDVHHGRVEDDHELRAEHDRERQVSAPLPAARGSGCGNGHVGTHLAITDVR